MNNMEFITEVDGKYMIVLEVPGYGKKDIKVSVSYVLSTEATLMIESSESSEWAYAFGLPSDANTEDIKAKVSKGILTVEIGKLEEVVREIEVK